MGALIASFACGLIFGIGLVISGMANPEKVLGFLDLFGAWDATLIVVMAAALVVTTIGYAFARKQAQPLFAPKSYWPTATGIDGKLILGAAIFGLGWGLVGLCPGPALVNILTLSPKLLVFVVCMGVGAWLREAMQRRASSTTP